MANSILEIRALLADNHSSTIAIVTAVTPGSYQTEVDDGGVTKTVNGNGFPLAVNDAVFITGSVVTGVYSDVSTSLTATLTSPVL